MRAKHPKTRPEDEFSDPRRARMMRQVSEDALARRAFSGAFIRPQEQRHDRR